MANFFSADLLWCGSRPPVHQIKKNLLITPHPRGAKHLFWIGRLPLTRAACVLALSEQREAEKPDPEKARQYRAGDLRFCKAMMRERIRHP